MRRGGIFAILYCLGEWLSEKVEKEIPAENWANKELYNQDLQNGVPIEQRMKNLKNGKYKQAEKPSWYQEPHRGPDGKIVIENCQLYESDIETYGVVQTMKWVQQGKYNLSPEELKKERERIQAQIDYMCSL